MERRRVSDRIVEELRRRIVSGVWRDGGQIPTERELAAEFDVSPNTVREAIRALSALGLVGVRQGSGAYVQLAPAALVSSSLGTVMRVGSVPIADVFELSRVLHLRIGDLAVERATDEEIAQLESIARTDPVEDPGSGLTQVASLLAMLNEAGHEPLVSAVAGSLDRLIVGTIAITVGADPAALVPEMRAARREWRAIVDGIRARDRARTREAIERYYDLARTITESSDSLRGARVNADDWMRVLEDLSVGRASGFLR